MSAAVAVITAPDNLFWIVLAVAGLALLIAVPMCLYAGGQHREIRVLERRNARLEERFDAMAEANAQLRATRRPVAEPEPEQTLTLPRDPHATQRIPAHQPPTRTARHGEGT